MTTADWLIIAVILLNVILAAMHGFFAEALSMAGLVVGYLVAAWQYQRLAEWLLSFLNSEMLAEIFGFLIIFFVILMIFSIAGRIARRLHEGSWPERFRSVSGWVVGLVKGCAGCGCHSDGNGCIHSHHIVAGEIGIGTLFFSSGTGSDMACPVGVAGKVRRRTGFPASRTEGLIGNACRISQMSSDEILD